MKPISATSSKPQLLKTFALVPFPASNIPAIEVTGTVSRRGNLFAIHYEVTGDIEAILLPAQSDAPARKDELWKATCFEFFLAVKDQPGYWEFNLSPSSDWNVYAMDTYRRIGFREEAAISQLPFEFKQTNQNLSLDISVELTSLLHTEQNIELGITSIIQTKNGIETYWALAHPGQQADFHLRESFVIEI